MDAFSLLSSVGGVGFAIASFLVVLGVVVFIHEYGHYIVARWCGIHAEVFSIGFGKELFHWVDKRGTRWRLAVLPLGGYVKFLGDGDAASARADLHELENMSEAQRARSFPGAALWKRALAVAAGPGFNFILSIVIYAGLAMSLGIGSDRPVIGAVDESATAIEAGLDPLQVGDEVISVEGTPVERFADISRAFAAASDAEPGRERFEVVVRRDGQELALETPAAIPPVVGAVTPDSPAEAAGFKPGDRILTINGQKVGAFADLQRIVIASGGADPVEMVLDDGTGPRETLLTAKMQPYPTADGGIEMRPLIGVTAIPRLAPEVVTPGPLEAVELGAVRTWQIIASSFAYVGAIIDGQADSSGLGGPIKIASLSGQAAGAGIVAFLGMIAMISASIGMINLFPIPVLDGGHLLFYAIEALRGRPLGEKAAEYATGFGLAVVVGLMVFVTYNDLMGL
ncbi:RIP metalloprotease RseP [Albimonas sp. CAU 1670]|uniref:RIP metalloprotease RseP n=1 Tax=Albimonas sp. CAU 1670 TaxID=3032599 RepID=UPI0023DCB6E5|nr:RIP metalloprotease RseP [Albimonas sp. CAU 1670]MDF2235476.1 RIP metalloprotease RseP [Albimonas sp. CAU 1670]